MTILQYDGTTPIKWVHNDNYGDGFTLNDGRHILQSYALEDCMNSGEKNTHRFFETSYQSDVYLFKLETL